MKLIVLFLVSSLVYQNVYSAMSEAQVKAAIKLIKNVCQPKSKVTNAQLEEMHTGIFNQDDQVMLVYMECVVRTAQIFKDGKLNYEGAKAQLANLPPSLAESAAVTFERCKDIVTSDDKFVGAFQFYKCFYEANPEGFYLP